MKNHLKRALELAFIPVAAVIVFVEEVLLHYLGVAMAAFAQWPPVARFERWLASLPPWAALLAFVAPSTLVLPVKLAAVFFALQGRFGLAAASIALGKILATALLARLYQVLRPTLVTMPWFLASETWIFTWRDRLYAFVRALPAWQKMTVLVQRLRSWLGIGFRRSATLESGDELKGEAEKHAVR